MEDFENDALHSLSQAGIAGLCRPSADERAPERRRDTDGHALATRAPIPKLTAQRSRRPIAAGRTSKALARRSRAA